MGTVTAPVEGSGSCPSWMARVAKPCLLFFFFMKIYFLVLGKCRDPSTRDLVAKLRSGQSRNEKLKDDHARFHPQISFSTNTAQQNLQLPSRYACPVQDVSRC